MVGTLIALNAMHIDIFSFGYEVRDSEHRFIKKIDEFNKNFSEGMRMTNLKEAQKESRIKDFIQEHSKDPKGDKGKFDKTLDSMISSSDKSKSTQETSAQDSFEN